ncbi:hypothetical protein Afil01_51540 [Actinorhabdospora filicis]|uniref:Uncharacterized protein n=1 Tax=Actinorhabdospora filicis TaxID=1785913 RepID=A0A9W6W5G2_9ACTN|nr:DUF6191 domain-containing protein [Actinorhabdospora filicis]GLZ80347.1 hypothetical protein Afil01_51540 [Actinorhabdospora filicis]
MAAFFAMSLPGLVLLLTVLAILDQLAVKAGKTRWIPWRGSKRAGQISSTGFDQLHAAIVPGKEQELQQRKSMTMMREDEESGAGADEIDLDAGVVRISRARRGRR